MPRPYIIPKERYDKDGTLYQKEVVLGQKIQRAYNCFPIDFAINNITGRYDPGITDFLLFLGGLSSFTPSSIYAIMSSVI